MSEGAKSQASVSRSRPAGSRRNQQPACTSEDSGVRYSTRSRSNVAPTPPRSAENQRSRKASNMEKPASSAQDGGPSGGKLSAHGGKAELAEESWGLQKPKESVSTYASRVMSHLREYEEASKTIRRLREELRCTSAKAAGASRPRKTQLQAEVKQLKLEINELEVRKAFLREKSGPFKEKLINEDRFREMADNREQRQMGLQPESQVDDDDDDQQKAPPGSLQSHPQATCSELPAGQATLASGRSSAGSGEDSDSSGQGGALMAEIKLLESPVCLQNFHLGDDLPEEAPGDQKKNVKKNKPKLQEALIKTADLDQNKTYIFGFHPHGVLIAGGFTNFCTDATGFPDLFPGITPYLLMLPLWFRAPFFRDYIMSGGLIPSDKESVTYLLKKKKAGTAVVIAVGGAPESLDARPGAFTILLKNRKGFIKLAIENGASLVPVFSFGENELFDQVENPKGSLLRSFQEKLQRLMGVALPLFHARGVFQYSFGLMPYRRPINTIVGKPIPVLENPNPTSEEVDRLHQLYTEKLSELFEEHKTKYNVPADRHLTFI